MEPQVSDQCRICRSTLADGFNTKWSNIFTGVVSSQLLLIIEEVTGHKLKQDYNLPECICLNCLASAKTALSFKRRFEQSFQLMKKNRTRNQDPLKDPPEKKFNSVSEECQIDDLEFLTENDSKDSKRKEKQLQNEKLPLNCSQCSKAFINNGLLKRHLRTHSGERPFQCSQCSSSFAHKGMLMIHLRAHYDERPFQCSHCFKTFSILKNLNDHIRLHTKGRPFKCSHCLKNFAEESKLKTHLCSPTDGQPLKCSHCSKTFTYRNTFLYHLSTHNKDDDEDI